MRLRGYGNAIVPEVGAIFIQEGLAAWGEVRAEVGMNHKDTKALGGAER